MKTIAFTTIAALSVILVGCNSGQHTVDTAEPKVAGDTVTIPTNAPQCAALTVEPVGEPPPLSLRFTGRLVWDENATARVFTPFSGIVRHGRRPRGSVRYRDDGAAGPRL